MATPFTINVDFSPNDTVFVIVEDKNNNQTHCVKEGTVKAIETRTLVSGTTIEYQVLFNGESSVTIVTEDIFGDLPTALTAYQTTF